MLWRSAGALALLTAMTLLQPGPVNDDTWLARTADGAPLLWPCCRTIPVYVEGVPASERTVVRRAVLRARALTGLPLQPTTARPGDGDVGIQIVWTTKPMPPGVLATTQDYAMPGCACLAAAQVRVSRRAVEDMPGPAIEVLVLHELGHAVGLRDFGHGLMNPMFDPGAAPTTVERLLLAQAGQRPAPSGRCRSKCRG